MDDPATMRRLVELVADLIDAKSIEGAATKKRIVIEEKIAALIPTDEPGQRTVSLDSTRKIVVRRELSYKADLEEIEKLFSSEGESKSVPIKVKTTRELDSAGYEWYRNNDPQTFALLSQRVQVTPRKVSVTLKI